MPQRAVSPSLSAEGSLCTVNVFPFSLKSQGQCLSWQGEGGQAGHLQLIPPRERTLPEGAPREAVRPVTAWSGADGTVSPSRAPAATGQSEHLFQSPQPSPWGCGGAPTPPSHLYLCRSHKFSRHWENSEASTPSSRLASPRGGR